MRSLLLIATVVAGMTTARADRLSWWMESRFGMFVHFGLYAMPAGGEWIKYKSTIPEAEYDQYFRRFDPDRLDARAWAKTARAAGMRYVVLTAKHHEGFCLFDSKHTDYKITRTPFGRDLVREFAEACRAEGLKVGLYYSLIDWHHPDFTVDAAHPLHPKDDKEWNDPRAYEPLNVGRDMSRYRAYIKDQLTELLTDYGRIDVLWLDFSYPKSVTPKGRADWDSKGIVELCRRLQPDILLNDRLDLDDTDWGWDFVSPEQFRVPRWPERNGRKVPWETCQTFSGKWGYHRDEMTWKSIPQLLELLVSTVSKGGNLILNVGPTARGEFDGRARDRLSAMGEWLKVNGRSVYGCTQAPDGFVAPEYSVLTYNPKLRRLYVHLVFYPMGALACSFGDQVAYAQFLHDGSEVKIAPLPQALTGKYPEAPKYNFILPVVKPALEMPVIECYLRDEKTSSDSGRKGCSGTAGANNPLKELDL